MRHATWMSIESNPFAMQLYRSYLKLPQPVRSAARWFAMPRWEIATAVVQARAQNRVLSGPFKGLTLDLSSLSRRNLLGYLLGSQEAELKGVVEAIVARRYSSIINVGAADGFYAVGLLRRLPDARAVAFEAIAEHHPGIQRTAQKNGVTARLTLKGLCQSADLASTLETATDTPLLLMDIEGAELELLDPAKTPGLAGADILVETHDVFVPGCTAELERRFAPTHTIERVTARPRNIGDFPSDALPGLARFSPGLAVELMNERRAGTQQWLFLTARR